MRGTVSCLTDMKYHFPPSGRTFLTGASVWASLLFCILVRRMTGLMLRRGVRAGRRSSPAKRVYGLKPVSRVQISPSPPHTQVKRRVTVKGNSPFLHLNGAKFGPLRGGVHTAIHTFGESVGEMLNPLPLAPCSGYSLIIDREPFSPSITLYPFSAFPKAQ